nr:protein LEO1 homolog [Arachis hypogaea]
MQQRRNDHTKKAMRSQRGEVEYNRVQEGSTGTDGSPREDKDQIHNSAPEIRDVFGDFDDDEEEDGYAVHHDIEHDSNRSPVEEEGYEKGLRPEDILADEDHRYGLEEENYEMKTKEKPLGLPLELEVPLQPPPALPEKVPK